MLWICIIVYMIGIVLASMIITTYKFSPREEILFSLFWLPYCLYRVVKALITNKWG